jgi:microcystin-dependent protein
MGQPFVGEIRLFGGNFAPAGWMFCSGQLLPISENETLFNLIGTTYGGDGQSTFALPDLQSRVPIHQGQLTGGGGSGNYQLAETGGVESVTLTTNQIPIHSHLAGCSSAPGNSASPANGIPAVNDTALAYVAAAAPQANMNAAAIQNTGGSQPHDNIQPFLCVSYIISLFGIFPSPT